MQQFPHEQSARSLRAGRTNPALPGVRPIATPIYVPTSPRQRWPQLSAGKRSYTLRRASLHLVLVGLLLVFCFSLLYSLFGRALPDAFVARAFPHAFPWSVDLAWMQQFLGWMATTAHLPWLDLHSASPLVAINVALLTLGIAGALLLLAGRVGQRALRGRWPEKPIGFLLAVVCLFTLLFGIFFVFLPGSLSQQALLSGLYGRLILVYHVNPYLVGAPLLTHDPLYNALTPGTFTSPTMGPLWLDLTVLPTWLAQANPVTTVLAFRILGLGLHVVNALLLWGILAKLKPETRLAGTILYAWNPAILLLGVSEAQMGLATIFFLLLGAFLLQRRSLLLSWVCFVLAALINPLCLLLLPLFLRALAREMRMASRGGRAFWWLLCVLLCALVIALAYAPYWPGLGLNGIGLHLRAAFWEDSAQSSLLAALSKLPFASWPPAAWLLTPYHWLLLLAVVLAGLLLLGIWITDNLELALLFSSWISLALFILLPVNMPWLILLPLALSLASSSRRTTLLAHLLTAGTLTTYCLEYWPGHWDGLALVTIGLAVLIWGWTLFFLSTWKMTHQKGDEEVPTMRKRTGLSRPSWPARPSAWPSRPSWPQTRRL